MYHRLGVQIGTGAGHAPPTRTPNHPCVSTGTRPGVWHRAGDVRAFRSPDDSRPVRASIPAPPASDPLLHTHADGAAAMARQAGMRRYDGFRKAGHRDADHRLAAGRNGAAGEACHSRPRNRTPVEERDEDKPRQWRGEPDRAGGWAPGVPAAYARQTSDTVCRLSNHLPGMATSPRMNSNAASFTPSAPGTSRSG